ncbi:beta-galactosidase [Massilia glaciei]|uniref:Beta-galactosidase n=1 Tax=Massilia glaciei TaxID=1524097 RepID=A0A2U2I6V2_9BURK|nr:beta-galactosidase [Massilia glaciei]PWF55486.1 beta-galactosidase [Massilia glaciei]
MKLGVCYYPEQWPEQMWDDDARRMKSMGISLVRIAEFAWSRIEPAPGQLVWDWLDRAIETLHRHGLQVVMCTPTATPPKWLVDRDPGMLAVDQHGRARAFGSRRHYCFSHRGYRAEAVRISELVAQRYGEHPAVAAWQTDNEYGCHDTIVSYSEAAREGFRAWLERRYGDIGTLNTQWGTVFWSQEYNGFDQIDPPIGTVTEANPAHRLDYRRFASDEVVAFNRLQTDLLRRRSPGRPVSHNFMGFFTEFNHYDVARDLDIATWDSYPLGFTQNFFLAPAEKARWARIGHPDIAAFHHDLYRGMCNGRWWVMEQQPGPVNWAQWNPAPAAGVVRLWSWQAFAHGAEVVSYFRWRQAPFAQEQMHAGLNRCDNTLDIGGEEATQVAREVRELARHVGGQRVVPSTRVALVFDYEAQWMAQITPHGADFNYLELAFEVYSQLRQLGLDVDIVGPHAAVADYALLVLPSQMHVGEQLAQRLRTFAGAIVMGPRTASKTEGFSLADGAAAALLALVAGVRVLQVESLPPGVSDPVHGLPQPACAGRWREWLELNGAVAEARFEDGRCAVARNGLCRYVGAWLDAAGWRAVLAAAATSAGIETVDLPADVRISRLDGLVFAFNFSQREVGWKPAQASLRVLGDETLGPLQMSIWKLSDAVAGH